MRRVRAGGLIALALTLACTSEGVTDAVQGAKEFVGAPGPGGPVRTDPWTRATPETIEQATKTLDRVVRAEALASNDETWMLVHAMEAFGPGVETHSGTDAMFFVLQHCCTIEGTPFPAVTESGMLRDPHPNHSLAFLLRARDEHDSSQPFGDELVVGDRRISLSAANARTKATFEHPTEWGEQAWTLLALAQSVGRENPDGVFTNAKGESFAGLALAREAARSLEDDMQFLEDARREGRAVRKRGQGVWSHPCGGLHLVEAVARWLDVREDDELRASLEHIRDVLAYRIGVEADLYAWMRAQAPADIVVKLDAQELKFFGHVLEVAGELDDAEVSLPRAVLDESEARLVRAVQRLEQAGVLDRVHELRDSDPQLHRDIVGDGAHALAGLALQRKRDRNTVAP